MQQAMRKLNRPWTSEDAEQLKKLHISGASALRASIALKRNKAGLMRRARELGIPFASLRDRKKQQAGTER